MNPNLRQIVLTALSEGGWTLTDYTAIALKSYPTAVGLKEALAYLPTPREDALQAVLSGEYWSEGRNVLGNQSVLIPVDASDDMVKVLAERFVSNADTAVHGSYAAKLYRDYPEAYQTPAP